jgi:hypothetical protein
VLKHRLPIGDDLHCFICPDGMVLDSIFLESQLMDTDVPNDHSENDRSFQLRDRVETPNGAGLVVGVYLVEGVMWYFVDHPSLYDGYQQNYRVGSLSLIPEN